MNRNFIFIFIFILASLLIVNAFPPNLRKRVTTFQACATDPEIQVTEIEPDPLVPGSIGKFHVSGTLAKEIPKGYVLAVGFFDTSPKEPILVGSPFDAPICQPEGALPCPNPANSLFDVILSGTVPAALPQTYGVLVILGDATLNVVIGCARAFVTGAAAPPAAPAPAPAATPPPAPAP